MRRKIRLLTPIHRSAASGRIKLRPATESRSPTVHRALPALTALLVLLTGACSTSGGSDGIDQSSPRSLAIGVVTAARQGRDVTGYAIVDHDTDEVCTASTCRDLTALKRATGVCADLEGELTARVKTANRDDSTSVMVYVTTADDDSGRCSFHVSEQHGRWWLSD